MARPWKPPSAVSKRLLGYGGLRKGNRVGNAQGSRKPQRPGGAAAFGGRGGPPAPSASQTKARAGRPSGPPALALCALRAPAAPPRGRNVLHIPPGVPAPQPVAAGRQGVGQTRWKWRAAYAASITTGIRPKNRTSSPTITPSTIQIGLLLGEDAGWVKGCRFWGKG